MPIPHPALDGLFNVADCSGPVHGVTFAGNYTTNAIAPNPATDNALLRYEIGFDGPVTVDVYNALGQVIRHVDVGVQKQGAHTLSLDLNNLAEGRYVYRLTSLEYRAEGSLVILR